MRNPRAESVRLEDMRVFAVVANRRSFTSAADALAMPKQTVSRRVAELEAALGVTLLHRTTRRLELTDAGARYARRCAEVARIADDANREVVDADVEPRGTLRVTADPLFGDAFLGPIVVEYARTFPSVRIELVLTRRKVDLHAEGFDAAIRVGAVDDANVVASRLGPARVVCCASPKYVAAHGAPRTPRDLGRHTCIGTSLDGPTTRWPTKGGAVVVTPRLGLDSFALVYAATLAGVGVALMPSFACAADVKRGRLRVLLRDHVVDAGGVWLVHASRASDPARTRAFVTLAKDALARRPWQ